MAMTGQVQNSIGRSFNGRDVLLAQYEAFKNELSLWKQLGWYHGPNPTDNSVSTADLQTVGAYAHMTENMLANLYGTMQAFVDFLEANNEERLQMLRITRG